MPKSPELSNKPLDFVWRLYKESSQLVLPRNKMTSPVEIAVPLGILSVLVLVANSIVLYLVYKNRHMRTATNGFVVSLAISDILTGLVIFFQYLIGFKNTVVINVLYAVVLISGAVNLTAVTTDRYIAITRPFIYYELMAKYSKMTIFLTWLLSLSIALLPLCWRGNINVSYHKLYILLVVFTCVIIPFLFILFANIRIFRIVKNCIHKERKTLLGISKNEESPRQRITQRASHHSRAIIFSEAKIAKVFVVAAIIFAVTWFPVIYYTLAAGLGHYKAIPHILLEISPFMIILGSLANPIIYSFMKPDFKIATRILLKDKNCRRRDFSVIYKPNKNISTISHAFGTVKIIQHSVSEFDCQLPKETCL